MKDPNELNYTWNGQEETLKELQQKGKKAGLNVSGMSRNELISALQESMNATLNVLRQFSGKRWTGAGMKKNQLVQEAEKLGLQTSGNVKELKERIRFEKDRLIKEKEENPDQLPMWFYSSQLLPYKRASGKRGEPDSGFEKGDREWIVDRIIRDEKRDGREMLLIRWLGYAEPTWEPLDFLKKEIPRVVDLYFKRKNK